MVNRAFIQEVGPFRWLLRYGRLHFRKTILKRDSTLRLPTGVRIILPRQSRNSTEIYVTNANIDWGAEAIFARFAHPQRDFLDIGSHIGYYAAYLSPCVRRSYAFEPDARNHPGLYKNAGLVGNVEVVEMAVSSVDGTADFHAGQGSAVGSLNDVGGPTTKVRVITIDTFVANHEGIDVGLIKTDVEGHDLEALRGMQGTVTAFQPLILTECELTTALADLCAQWRYSIFAITRNTATRRSRFMELSASDRDNLHCKMLFLVPQILKPEFNCLKEN